MDLEGERWKFEKDIKQQELDIERRRLKLQEQDHQLRQSEAAKSAWGSPVVIAILAATVAAAGNAIVAVVNGEQSRALEDRKSEQARILEMIKTGNPDAAAENLKFLLDSGLLRDVSLRADIAEYLQDRQPGTGAALASSSPLMGGIVGFDERRKVADTTKPPYSSVCRIQTAQWMTSGALVRPNLMVTANLPNDADLSSMQVACGADLETAPENTLKPERLANKTVFIANPENKTVVLTFVKLAAANLPESFSIRDVAEVGGPAISLNLAGYAGDFRGGMFEATGTLLGFDETGIYHNLDTGFGAGGAPLYVNVGGEFMMIGVHIGSGERKMGARVNEEMIADAEIELGMSKQ